MKPSAPALATAATSSARADPLHAALDDRVLDAEHFGEACLDHGRRLPVLSNSDGRQTGAGVQRLTSGSAAAGDDLEHDGRHHARAALGFRTVNCRDRLGGLLLP